MATGGDLSRTLKGGHEPFYDFTCSLCEDVGRHVEAWKYCEECLVYLCDSCLTNHNRFPLNRRHQLLDRNQFATTKKSAIASFPTKRCPKHPGELINIYCGLHGVVCCSVCRTFEHSNCQGTEHLPDAAKDAHKSHEYHSFKAETTTLISQLDTVLGKRNADVSRIAKEKQVVEETIADFRRKANKYFDDLEKKGLDELDEKEEKILDDIHRDKNFLKMTKQQAEEILKHLESSKGGNECDLFYHVITGKQFVNGVQRDVQKMLESGQRPFIQFEINKDIESYLSSLSSLGFYAETDEITCAPLSLNPKVTTSGEVAAPLSSRKPQLSDQMAIYQTQFYGRFDIKHESDNAACCVRDICHLPDGSFLLSHFENKTIKKLDSSYKMEDSVKLSGSVHSVCSAGHNLAAVSLHMRKTVQLLSVGGGKLKMTKTFPVNTYCRGMCYIDGKLLICCGDVYNATSTACIKVYSTDGTFLHSIPHYPRYLSFVPLHIAVSDNRQNLFVTCNDSNDIPMLDMSGNIINTFKHKDLKKPSGICTDGTGQVFVCGYGSNTVVQLSPRHDKIEVILTNADGIYCPLGICFDRVHSRLLVGSFNSNEILVFSVNPLPHSNVF